MGRQSPGGRNGRYFVLTHWVLHEWVCWESPFTFVTDGIDSVLAQARAVAGDKGVGIGGGANVIRQSLATGLVEEPRLRVALVLLRVRKGLYDIFGNQIIELERISVVGSPYAIHLFFTVRL